LTRSNLSAELLQNVSSRLHSEYEDGNHALAVALITALISSASTCRNSFVHVSTLETVRHDTIVAVDASRTGGLIFPVLQSYERLLIDVGKREATVTNLYVEVLPKMTGSIEGKRELRVVEACVLALAYFNDNQLMFETTGGYQSDGHVGNLLYQEGGPRAEYQVYWADFGRTDTTHLPADFSTLPSPAMTGHFTKTTYSTLE
jgi:hypothetical protein